MFYYPKHTPRGSLEVSPFMSPLHPPSESLAPDDMLPAAAEPNFPSTEELTWLQASSILFDAPPTPPPKDDDPMHSHFDRLSLCSVSPSEPTVSPSKIIPPPIATPKGSTSHRRRNSSPMSLSQHRSASSEWLYRAPRSSPYPRSPALAPAATATGTYHPSSLSRSLSSASVRTTQTQDSASSVKSSSSTRSFWSAILRPAKLLQEKNATTTSLPSPSPLRTIPSQTQLVFTPTDPGPAPKTTSHHSRSASLCSTLDSVSLSYSPSSSRSESPITPVSISSPFPYGTKATRRRSYDLPQSHRRHRRYLHSESDMTTPTTPTKTMATMATTTPAFLTPPPIARSPPGTKSILTRTSSVSTRTSSHTTRTNSNKSVKFATLPTVYYSNPTRGLGGYGGNYWNLDPDNKSVDINIDSMDLDEDPFANYRSRVGDDDDEEEDEDEDDSEVEEQRKKNKKNESDKKPSAIARLRSVTPTPEREREKQKAMRVKRLLTFTRKASTSVVPNTGTVIQQQHHRHHYRTTSSVAAAATTTTSGTSARPAISSPYALGSYPHHYPLRDTHPYTTLNAISSTSSLNAPERPWTKSLKNQNGNAGGGHHSASCESLQSSKTTNSAFSMRSVDSFGSLSLQVGVGVGRFKDWLGKTIANGRGSG